MNLKMLLMKRSDKLFRNAPIAFLILSAAGFLDASYLALLHYTGAGASCFLVEGCDEVLTSPYSTVWGIPVALAGVLYYAAVFLFVLLYYAERREEYLLYIAYGTFAGFFASLGFLYLQIFVIQALCIYCLISASVSTLLFSLGVFVIYYKGRIALIQSE